MWVVTKFTVPLKKNNKKGCKMDETPQFPFFSGFGLKQNKTVTKKDCFWFVEGQRRGGGRRE
jgi:hypothetical protein